MNIRGSLILLLLAFSSLNLFSQQISVKGTVVDNTNTPLPGVNVIIKGTTKGTNTDFDGNYTLSNVEGTETLIFTSIGFVSKEISINGRTTINVTLEEDSALLDEIVVTGLGQSQNKKTVSTAVSTISSKKIGELPVSRPEAVLQGTTPGITVVQNSGAPGAPLTIRLRGAATPGSSQPLYLVDGIQVPDIAFVNPSDIKNITTLKDGASAAVYGARGGNGVVLITTKKGRQNGNLQVSIDGYTGFQNRLNTPNLMNRDQYIQYYNEYQTSVGGQTIAQSDIARLPDTNWYDVLFDDDPMKSFINASVSGGTEKSSYYFSGSIFDQEGLVGGKADKSGFDRKTINFNFNTELKKNLKLRLGANLIRVKQRRLPGENDDSVGGGNPFNQLAVLLPIFPVLDADGNYYDVSAQNGPNSVNGVAIPGVNGPFNPLLALDFSTIEDRSNNLFLNGGLEWNVLEDLTVDLNYGYYENLTTNKSFQESYDFRNGTVPNGIASLGNTGNNQLDESYFDNRFNQFDATIKYNFNKLIPEDHDLELLVGTTALEESNTFSARRAQGLSKNTFDDANFALVGDQSTIISPVQGSDREGSLLSYYTRATYNYKQKYLFTASLRADQSSKFGPGNRTGYFPAVSGGWVISEEDFFNQDSFVNLLKLRASWGINGADNIFDDQYRLVFNNTSNAIIGGSSVTGFTQAFLPNTDVKWEEVAQTNFGLDVNALDNKLGITFDYYNKTTTDVLLPVGVPSYVGLPTAFQNIGEVVNEGFEFLISYKQDYDSGFSWNANFNIAKNDNEVTDLAGVNPLRDGETLNFNDPISITVEGQPIASFYGYKVKEINANGELVFDDMVDGVAGLSNDDRTIIGNAFPDFTYGFNFGMNYKGFDFGGFLYGSEGNDIYDATTRTDFSLSNRPASYLTNGVQNLLGNTAGSNLRDVSDFYVKDGSFLKLRTITLGYSLPQSAIKSFGLSSARLYVTGENLFVITDYEGADPEIGQANVTSPLDIGIDRGFFPSAKAFIFGFQFKF
ncbi:TonB-dependent receptor [Tenacibaculum sp. 190524A05c]|uniref:SusC/RagA family TonB-linked outer membrane protein n=1 Tax=Tenacibaculum platacis TaxID=3137852 RepID=UPI0031FB200F